jgi:hypothetical protein
VFVFDRRGGYSPERSPFVSDNGAFGRRKRRRRGKNKLEV